MKIAIRVEGKRIEDLACIPIKEGQVPPETRRPGSATSTPTCQYRF
jgi:hypothetical protein